MADVVATLSQAPATPVIGTVQKTIQDQGVEPENSNDGCESKATHACSIHRTRRLW